MCCIACLVHSSATTDAQYYWYTSQIAAWAHFIVTVSLIALLIAGTIGVVLFFGVRCFEESTEAMQSTKLFVEDAITAQGWASFIDPNVTADAVEGTDAALERTVNWFESRWPNETMVVYKVYEVYQSYEFFKEHSEPPPVAANDYFHGEDQICDLNESNQSWWNVWHWPAAMGLGFDWHGDSAGDADHSPGDDVSWAFLREVMLIAADYISNVLWTVFGASTSIVSFMVSLLLFLNLLYYLLVLEVRRLLCQLKPFLFLPRTQRNWLSSCFALLPSREGRALHDALTDAVRQVFVVNGKVMAFNALYTWLLFNACGVEYYVYSATLGSVLSCVFPFLPLWCIAIPGGIVLAVRLCVALRCSVLCAEGLCSHPLCLQLMVGWLRLLDPALRRARLRGHVHVRRAGELPPFGARAVDHRRYGGVWPSGGGDRPPAGVRRRGQRCTAAPDVARVPGARGRAVEPQHVEVTRTNGAVVLSVPWVDD